jgi:hypothetical protein
LISAPSTPSHPSITPEEPASSWSAGRWLAALNPSKRPTGLLRKEEIALGLEETDRLSEQVRSLVNSAGEDKHLRETHSSLALPELVVAALGVGERLAGKRYGGLKLSLGRS